MILSHFHGPLNIKNDSSDGASVYLGHILVFEYLKFNCRKWINIVMRCGGICFFNDFGTVCRQLESCSFEWPAKKMYSLYVTSTGMVAFSHDFTIGISEESQNILNLKNVINEFWPMKNRYQTNHTLIE